MATFLNLLETRVGWDKLKICVRSATGAFEMFERSFAQMFAHRETLDARADAG